jgi:phenylpyruvate tautomerase PptA (4-oxalocrotonate tautomerase family)
MTMPFVQISLLKGKSREHCRAIADGVHEALVETYDVPPDDRFQVINEYDPEALIFDEDYRGIHRSPDVVFIHITASNTRDLPKKRALFKAIADRLEVRPSLRRQDVQVIIASNAREDWSFGDGVATYAT